MQTLVRPRESAAALHRRLLSPANAKLDIGIDLKRKPVGLMPLVAPEQPWLEALIDFNEALRVLNSVRADPPRIARRAAPLLPVVVAPRLPIHTIRMVVANHYSITVDDMIGPSRHRPYTRPRFIAMFLCSQLTGASLPLLGRMFGGRDHTTVLSAIRRVQEWVRDDADIAAEVDGLAEKIRRLHA